MRREGMYAGHIDSRAHTHYSQAHSPQLGKIGIFAASGAHLSTNDFTFDELVSFQRNLDKGDAYLFVRGEDLDESHSYSISELLRLSPLLVTSQELYLVASEPPKAPIRVVFQHKSFAIIGVADANSILPH